MNTTVPITLTSEQATEVRRVYEQDGPLPAIKLVRSWHDLSPAPEGFVNLRRAKAAVAAATEGLAAGPKERVPGCVTVNTNEGTFDVYDPDKDGIIRVVQWWNHKAPGIAPSHEGRLKRGDEGWSGYPTAVQRWAHGL